MYCNSDLPSWSTLNVLGGTKSATRNDGYSARTSEIIWSETHFAPTAWKVHPTLSENLSVAVAMVSATCPTGDSANVAA